MMTIALPPLVLLSKAFPELKPTDAGYFGLFVLKTG